MSRRVVAEEMEQALAKEEGNPAKAGFLSTGSTLWNLALSDRVNGGWGLGKIHRLVGGPASGKTFAAWTAFAEAIHDPYFDPYELHYRDIERAFQIGTFLFSKDAKKIARILPRLEDGKGKPVLGTWDGVPETIQDWRVDLDHLYKRDKAFIFALDSFDGLDSLEERARAAKANKAIEEEKKSKEGGFRTEKAVHGGLILRTAASQVARNNSLLLIVSQTRDNVGVMFGDSETTSGGNAPEFYSTTSSWLKVKKRIIKRENDVGVHVQVKVKKNKQTGKLRQIPLSIFYDYGINDLMSMIRWLVMEGFWEGPKDVEENSKIDPRGDFPEGKLIDIMRTIAQDSVLVNKLKSVVQDCWWEIEKEIATDLPSKYGE